MEEKMMALKRYRKADLNERLHLYLQFPHLRQAFLEIDMEKETLSNQPRTMETANY